MKSLTQYIQESLEDFGLVNNDSSKFKVAVSAFYLSAILRKSRGNEWKDFNDFLNKWGYGKELTDWDYSGRNPKKISTGPGLILFKHKDFNPESIEDIFDEMYNFSWYYVPDMGKWSTTPDETFTCFGQGMYIDDSGKIVKSKTSTYYQFKWNSKQDKWTYKEAKNTESNKVFIYGETGKINYVPVVLPYNEVLKAASDDNFIEEFTAALENNFKSIQDDYERYNELQDRLKAEFEKRHIFRSLWSTGNLTDQLDSLTGGYARDIMKFLTDEMGDRVSTFNVPEKLQDEICKKWADDIEDEDMLRKWMSMDGRTNAEDYFKHKYYLKKNNNK